jgi:anti-sigma factor RsiW
MSADYLAPRADSADAHARTWALIPWLVNGRADPAQRAAAEAHLAQCADCRAELQAQ